MGSYYGPVQHLAVDLETTGLDEAKNAIIEIGALPLDANLNKVPNIEAFHTLVRPFANANVHPRAIEVNGHTWVDDSESPFYKEARVYAHALEAFQEYLEKHFGPDPSFIVLVGWNVSFDERFLKRLWTRGTYADKAPVPDEDVLKEIGWPFHYHKIDLLSVCRYLEARAGKPQRRSYRLETMAEQYFGDISAFAMHTAMGDCEMQLKVLEAVEHDTRSGPGTTDAQPQDGVAAEPGDAKDAG